MSDIRIFLGLGRQEIYQAKGHSHSHSQKGGHRLCSFDARAPLFLLNHYLAAPRMVAERSLDEDEPGISTVPHHSNSLRNLAGTGGRLHRMRTGEILKISCTHLISPRSLLSASFEPVD